MNTPAAWTERAEMIADPWEACRWSRESQEARFDAVLWALDPKPGERFLDYGCGTGEFAEWLPASVSYVGFDTAPGMVLRAGRDHSAGHRRWMLTMPTGKFDVVAAVGPFNMAENWSKQHTWHAIRHLWDTTGCHALAVCLYAGDDETCLRYSEDEIERCGRQLGHDWSVVETLPNDLMLVVNR